MGMIRVVSRPGPIAWLAIDRWCEANRVTDEDRVYVHDLIRALDAVFLRFRNNAISQDMQTLMRK